MQTPGRLPLGLVTVLVFVVPGLIGLEMYFRASQRSRELSRTRLVVYSAAISLFSLLVLYFLSGPLTRRAEALGGWVRSTPLVISATVPVTQSTKAELASVVILYLAHLTLSVLIGVVSGLGSRLVVDRGVSRDRRNPWELAFEDEANESGKIVVVLEDGRAIAGTHETRGWDRDQRELLLFSPKDVTEESTSRFDIEAVTADKSDQEQRAGTNAPLEGTDSVLLTSDVISNVYFFEMDRDREVAKSSAASVATGLRGWASDHFPDLFDEPSKDSPNPERIDVDNLPDEIDSNSNNSNKTGSDK